MKVINLTLEVHDIDALFTALSLTAAAMQNTQLRIREQVDQQTQPVVGATLSSDNDSTQPPLVDSTQQP